MPNRRFSFGAPGCFLGVICLLAGESFGFAQDLSGSARNPGEQNSSAAPPLQTQRQRFAALREAQRFSKQSELSEKRGKFDEAERFAERALALDEQARGPWHIEVAHRLDQLADLYTAHRKEAQADPLYKRSREIRERALSAHPDVYEKDDGELRARRNQPAEKATDGKSSPPKTGKRR